MKNSFKKRFTLGVYATTLFCASMAQAFTLGPGVTGNTSSQADTGERANISKFPGSFAALPTGVYEVLDFQYSGTSNTGNVIPFIAEGLGGNSYRILWKGAPDSTSSGLNTVTYNGVTDRFIVRNSNQIYSGFYTESGGRVDFIQTAGQGPTDHWVTFNVANTEVGQTFNNPTNPELDRNYAYSVNANRMDTVYVGPREKPGNAVDTQDGTNRLNIDRNSGKSFSAGTYQISLFGFTGAVSDLQNTTASGEIVPFLVRNTSGNTFEYVWIGDPVANKLGWNDTFMDAEFTLTSAETLYAGFYTLNGGRVAFQDGTGATAHMGNGSYGTTMDSVLNATSFPNLARTYSFELAIQVPEPGKGLLILGSLSTLLIIRRRSTLG